MSIRFSWIILLFKTKRETVKSVSYFIFENDFKFNKSDKAKKKKKRDFLIFLKYQSLWIVNIRQKVLNVIPWTRCCVCYINLAIGWSTWNCFSYSFKNYKISPHAMDTRE